MTVSLLARLCLFGIACLGSTLLLGCLRRFPLGFAGTLCVGAYTGACLRIGAGWPWLVCILAGALAGGLFSLLPAFLDRNLQGDEYVVLSWMLALACAETVGLMQITGGQHSLINIPPLFGGRTGFAQGVWALGSLFGAAFLLSWLFRRSRSFQEARLAGLNPEVLAAAGRSVSSVSLQVHWLAGLCGGLAGTLWGAMYETLHPSMFGLPESVIILLVCLLGGQGEPVGVPVGLLVVFVLPRLIPLEVAVPLFTSISEFLGVTPPDPVLVASALDQAILGVLLVISLIWLREGVVVSLRAAWENRTRARL